MPRISPSLLPWALDLLQSLFAQAEARGFGVQDLQRSRPLQPPVFRITARGVEHPLTVREDQGTLILKLTNAPSGRRSWCDGTRTSLEDKISDLLAQLEARTRQVEQRRANEQREHDQEQRARQHREQRVRAHYADDQATHALRAHADAWRLAKQLRALCAEIRRLDTDGQAPTGARAWLAWAERHIDRLDPTRHSLSIPTPPEATPEQLDRYLDLEIDDQDLELPHDHTAQRSARRRDPTWPSRRPASRA